MGGPASLTTAEIYLQAHEHTAISTALHPPKFWEILIPFLNVRTWKTFSITTFSIFVKILSLLWGWTVMEN